MQHGHSLAMDRCGGGHTMKWVALFAIVGALGIAAAGAAGPITKPATDFVRPFPIVAIAKTASDAQRAAAKEIADALGVNVVSVMDKNPVCCVWLEVSGWTPNPGQAGYFIINQGGGSIISASDDQQLKKAVARFKESVRTGAEGVEVPVGMITSYRIVAASAAGR
jgi:hypothetical protein